MSLSLEEEGLKKVFKDLEGERMRVHCPGDQSLNTWDALVGDWGSPALGIPL